MKILMVLHSYPPERVGGVQLHVHNLAKELARSEDVSVLAADGRGLAPDYEYWEEQQDELNVVRLAVPRIEDPCRWRSVADFGAVRAFQRILRDRRPDIVHVHHTKYLSPLILQSASELKLPLLKTIHDFWMFCPRTHMLRSDDLSCEDPLMGVGCVGCFAPVPDGSAEQRGGEWNSNGGDRGLSSSLKRIVPRGLKHTLKQFFFSDLNKIPRIEYAVQALSEDQRASFFVTRHQLMNRLLQMPDLMIAPSRFVANRLIQSGIREEKILLIRHGIPNEGFSEFTKKEYPGRIRFAFFGPVTRHKGVEVLIRAFNRITDKNAFLALHGNIEPDYLHELRNLITSDNISIMGEYEPDRMPRLLSETDIVVVPSLCAETFSMVTGEALAAKVPVIVSRAGALEEMIVHEKNGLLVEAGNEHQLFDALASIVSRPEKILEFSENIETGKTMAEYGREIRDVYQSLRHGGEG